MIITGKTGQLAQSFSRALRELGLEEDSYFLSRNEIDLAEIDKIEETLDRILRIDPPRFSQKQRILINTAAYTAVDRAETEKTIAQKVNSDAPGVLARWALRNDFLFVHYSTDYVFDGNGSTPWKESDPAHPLNHYGVTKRAGELEVLKSGCRYLIFRTSWLYSREGKNFPNTILRLAREKSELKIVNDQIDAPPLTDDLAHLSLKAIQQTVSDPEKGGIYRLSNSGESSWFGVAESLLQLTEEQRLKDSTDKEIEKFLPIQSEEFPTPAKRPKNSRLDLSLFEKTFNLKPRDWQAALKDFFTHEHESFTLKR